MKHTFAAILVAGLAATAAAQEKLPEKVTYDEHVRAVFRSHCFTCHNLDKKSGGLDLTSYTALMQGGSSGPVIEPGEPDFSYLFGLISHESRPYMPPKTDKIPDEDLALVRAWIAGGVLENSGSKALKSDKPKFDMALTAAPTGRPEVAPLPQRLPLEPVVHTSRPGQVTGLATSPWAALTAVAGQQQVLLYDTRTLDLVGVLPFPEGVPQVLRFSRNGSLLLAGGGQAGAVGKAVVWNVKTGERVATVGDELDSVLAADISADQSMVALGGPQRIVRVYSLKTGELLYAMRKHTEWIYDVEFSPDGVLLATADRNGGTFVWEALTGREYLTLDGHKQAVTSLSWRSDSNVVATGSEDGSIKLWEVARGNQVKSWNAHGGGVSAIEFARDGHLVSCGRDKTAKLWDQNGKQVRAFPAMDDLALRVSYCDESSRVVAGDWTGTIKVWEAKDGKPVGELSSNPPPVEERLKLAEAALQTARADYEKLDAAAKAKEAEAAQTKAALDAASKAVATQQKAIQDATTAMNTAKAAMEKATAEQKTAEARAAAIQPLVPLLTEAHAKAKQAADKVKGDKELAALTAQAKAQLDEKSAALAAAKKTAAEKQQAAAKAKEQFDAAAKRIAEAKAALEAAQKQVADLTPKVKTTGEAAAAARKAADAAQPKVDAAARQVSRWKDELVFVEHVRELDRKQDEHLKLLDAQATAQAAVEEKQSQLAAAEKSLADLQKQTANVQAATKKTQEQLQAASAEREKIARSVSALEAAVPLLSESVAKSQEALKQLGTDEQLKTTLATLQATLQAKQQALDAAKKTVAEKQALATKLQQTLAEQQKQAQALAPKVDDAEKLVATRKQAVEAEQAKLASAKKAADEFAAALDALKKQVDALRTQGTAGTSDQQAAR